MTLRLLVLVSGAGTLLQALLDAQASGDLAAEVVAVGADRPGIEGLARAERDDLDLDAGRGLKARQDEAEQA